MRLQNKVCPDVWRCGLSSYHASRRWAVELVGWIIADHLCFQLLSLITSISPNLFAVQKALQVIPDRKIVKMRVLENSMVNLEVMPGKSGEQLQQDAGAQVQGAAGQAQDMTKGAQDSAHKAAKDNLPEGAQGYAGQAVNYAGNFASGTVGTVGNTVKDTGDTLGNAVC